MFMTGIPGFGSSGFCLMDPETLRKQRWTYVKYWRNKLINDVKHVIAAFNKK
jgi:hypothetical protein